MKAEAALVVAGGVLLVGVRCEERRVEVEDHLLGRSASSPRTFAGLGARDADRVALAIADLKQHASRRRARRDLAEQRDLVAQRTEI